MVRNSLYAIFVMLSAGLCAHASGARNLICSEAPICQRAWRTPVVFVGTAESIGLESGDDGHLVRQRVRISVQEAFRGVEGTTLEVVTDYRPANSYEALPFRRGVQYLVFAQPEYGETMVRRCYPPRPIAEAQEDLSYLESTRLASPGSLVYGNLMRKQGGDGDDPEAPLAGVKIRIEGADEKIEVTTDGLGNYSIPNLSAGKYTIQPLLADKLEPIEAQPIEVPERGCVPLNFETSYNGRIRGKITGLDGNPLAKANVEIYSADEPEGRYGSDHYETDDHGLFEIDSLAPGRYILGVNLQFAPDAASPCERTFYPGVLTRSAATPVSVGKGELLEGYDIRVKEIEEIHTFTVRVVSAKGEPAPDATVTFRYADGSWQVTDRSDKKGEIEISAYGHGVVSLQAHIFTATQPETDSEPITLSLAQIPKNVELRLTKVKERQDSDDFGSRY
jgi:hypothetical protein